MNLLTIEQVSKTYGTVKAVDQVNLSIPKQSIFGLLGPNGAGKTTLIRMITNILFQDSGNIILDGISSGERNMLIGYMPEERGLYKKMKVGEQLMYLAQLKNLSAKTAKERINYWFDRFQIDWWNKKVEELSKGMQQKIQFIATVVHQPKLIILDEPFSGLDPINANLIRSEIYNLKKEGATILFSTHRMEQAEEICEQIALINQGKIILKGDIKALQEQFKENKFSVEYDGTLPPLHHPDFPVLAHNKQTLTIGLGQQHRANDLLEYLIQEGVEVHAFNEVLPSLNEIFIHQVQAN